MFLDNGHDLAKMLDVFFKSVDLAFADIVIDYLFGFCEFESKGMIMQ